MCFVYLVKFVLYIFEIDSKYHFISILQTKYNIINFAENDTHVRLFLYISFETN